jgi:hypothetical protein
MSDSSLLSESTHDGSLWLSHPSLAPLVSPSTGIHPLHWYCSSSLFSHLYPLNLLESFLLVPFLSALHRSGEGVRRPDLALMTHWSVLPIQSHLSYTTWHHRDTGIFRRSNSSSTMGSLHSSLIGFSTNPVTLFSHRHCNDCCSVDTRLDYRLPISTPL